MGEVAQGALPPAFQAFARSHPAQLEHLGAEGIPFVHCRDASSPSVALAFFLRAGVLYESPQEWGMSHFLEHVLMRSTQAYASLYELSRKIEGIGGQTSAYSTRDLVGYWVKIPAGQEAAGLDVLAHILFGSDIRPEAIAAERAIIAQERVRERTNPSLFTSLAVESLLLEPHPISRHPVGEDAFLQALTPGQLNQFLGRVYNRTNLVVVGAGNLAANVGDLISAAAARCRLGDAVVPADFTLPDRWQGWPAGKQRVVIVPSAHKEQVFVALAWRFPVTSRRELLAARVLNTLLGAGYTSLLNVTLRERESLTYVCSTATNYYAQVAGGAADSGGTGIFKVHMGVNKRNLARSLELLHAIIADVAQEHVSPDIFAEAKVRHAASVVYRYENSLDVARLLAHAWVREGYLQDLDEYLRMIESVSLEEVSALARQWLTESDNTLLLQTGAPEVEALYPQARRWE